MRKAARMFLLFAAGGVGYPLLELLWRRRTHWSMGLAGGCILCGLGELTDRLNGCGAVTRALSGGLCITTAELLIGLTVNVYGGCAVWDYSGERGSLCGQICPQYFLLWCLLSLPLTAGLRRLRNAGDGACQID